MRFWTGFRAIVIAAGLILLAAPVVSRDAFADSVPAVEGRVQSTCPAPGDPVTLSSIEMVSELVVGTWIRCEGSPQFGGVAGDEVGIQVDADGRFYRVFQADDGTLIRADGLDQEGEWTVIDTTNMNGPGSFQINWGVSGNGTIITQPSFFGSPSSLRLETLVGSARYQPWTGAPPVPGLPPGADAGRCGHPTGAITPLSVEQVQDLLVGTWNLCGDTSPLGDPSREVGLEFTADGRFYRLVRNSNGDTIRGVGNREEGTWTVIDTTNENGLASYQVNFQVLGSGTSITHPVFLANPAFVRFVGMELSAADYLREEPFDLRGEPFVEPPASPAATPAAATPTFTG